MQLIGLTGLNASGKGTAAEYLIEKGFSYYSLSDIVRDYASEKGLDHSRGNLITCGNEMRKKFGPSVLAKRALKKILKDKPSKVVVDSIRNVFEIEELRNNGNFLLIGIDAPIEIRFERSKKRGRTGFEASLDEFIKIEQEENSADPKKQQLFDCLKLSDAIIENCGTVEELKTKLDMILLDNE
ncbi:MAG: AAA family ATPase [Candidatus Margulisiibacteriota bacterium]